MNNLLNYDMDFSDDRNAEDARMTKLILSGCMS